LKLTKKIIIINKNFKFCEDGQAIRVSLEEIDRSDIFIALFGQKYGWYINDKDLSLTSSMSNARDFYSWIDQFDDRSLPELEIRHAHLNNVGKLPTFFYFRDKG